LSRGSEDKYPKPKARQGAKPQTLKRSLYVDEDEDSETTQVDRHSHKSAGVKAKSSRVGADPPPDSENGRHIAAKSMDRARSIKPSKTTAIPESDGEEEPPLAPSRRSIKAGKHSSVSSGEAKVAAKSSSKRSRDTAGSEGPESDPEEPAPAPARKRAKAIVPPASDDETLVGTVGSRPIIAPSEIAKDHPSKM
jgi:hypothetical protein